MNGPEEPRGRRVDQVELHYGVATDVGLVREVNEDSLLADPPVFVVADGMGGHENGDVASRIVVEEFARLADAGYDPTEGDVPAVADNLGELDTSDGPPPATAPSARP